jgi:hypothetical protein
MTKQRRVCASENLMHTPTQSASSPERLLSWAPLFLGAINSYGPVAFNYGFALYFLTYQHGFVKRGLLGEVLSPIHWLPRSRLLLIEYLFLALAFALTYGVFRSLLFGTQAQRRLSAALLGAPALLSHIGYLFAQPDVTLYILLLLCIWLFLRFQAVTAALGSAILCCTALLVHEAFCLMFYPLIAAILLRLAQRRRLPWVIPAIHVLLVSAVFAAVMHWGQLHTSPHTILSEAQARTNIGVQRQVYDVMASNFREQEVLVRRMYSRGVLWTLAATIAISAPYVFLLLRLLNRTMCRTGASNAQRALTMLMFASPLLLCALGHDTTRWIGAGCMDATLFLLFIYMTEPEESGAREYLDSWTKGRSYVPWLVYLVGIGPYGATGLSSAGQLVNAWLGP